MVAEEENTFFRFCNKLIYILDVPVTYFRENIVKPNQKKYPWYHQNFRRVPTIDECYIYDGACLVEAQCQFERDKLVEDAILGILRQRYEDCCWYYYEDRETLCGDLFDVYKQAEGAWTAKYADLGPSFSVVKAFMKQKHRMIWERRHGEVGSGATNKKYDF